MCYFILCYYLAVILCGFNKVCACNDDNAANIVQSLHNKSV